MKSLGRWMMLGLAAVAFVAPLKLGTPVMLQSAVPPPATGLEWLIWSWPNEVGWLLCGAGLLGWALDRRRMAARKDVLFLLPLLFLVTQVVALPGTINWQSSRDTLVHLGMCVFLFYAAARYVRDGADAARVFAGLGVASLLVCVFALDQWHGGLEETRQFVSENFDPANVSPEMALRMTSQRVYGTLVYPNALAGFVVVALGPVLAWIWVRGRNWDAKVRLVALGLMGGLMVWVLVLTGSRGGMVAFGVAVLVAVVSGGKPKWVGGALAVVGLIFVGGWAAGWVKLGTNSLDARLDYWEGAVAIIRDHPWRGTGPGTFGSIYAKYKTGLTEEAQVVHNNFLQMWTDSGVVAFGVFAALWVVGLRDALRLAAARRGDAAAVAIAAGLAGWTVHGLVDFDLYVPGVAWPAFLLLGMVQGLKEPPPGDEHESRWYGIRAAAGVVAVMVVVWLSGRSLAAAFAHSEMREAQATNPFAALAAGRRAVALAPRNSHYHSFVGDVAVQLRQFDEAVRNYEAAIAHDPYRASYRWRLARVWLAQGGHDREAGEQLRAAAALNPTKELYRAELAAFEESVRQGERRLLESAPVGQP